MKQFSEGKWVSAELSFAANYWNFTDLSDYAVSQLWACWGVRAVAGVIVSIQQSSAQFIQSNVFQNCGEGHALSASLWLAPYPDREHGCAIPPVCLLTSC